MSTVGTLRQLVIFIVDPCRRSGSPPAVRKCARIDHPSRRNDAARFLGPTACDAFAIFEDLCLLGNGEQVQYLQVELIESVLTNHLNLSAKRVSLSTHILFVSSLKHPELLLLLQYHPRTSPHNALLSYFPSRSAAHTSFFSYSKQSWPNLRQTTKFSSRCSSNSSVAKRG